jgi:hypothetical protein
VRARLAPLSLLVALALPWAAAACEQGASVIGYDVVLTPTSQCTLTGQATRTCADPAVLANTTITGRLLVDFASDGQGATITTHEGLTLPGLVFPNNGTIITTDGCDGNGGTCLFFRRRFDSRDANNNNCRRFGELIAVATLDADDDNRIAGITSDLNGNDANCGTPTINETVFSFAGEAVLDPVRARNEGVSP